MILREFVKKCVREVLTEDYNQEKLQHLLNEKSLNEMALDRGKYINMGINQSAIVLKHIGKICVYEGDDMMFHYIKHWEDEIAAQIYDLGKIDVKGDNKVCKIKKKAYIESFINARLGENLSEYDTKMPSYIMDGLEDEGMTMNQMRNIDFNGIASKNKERIKKYLYSFVDILSIKDLIELKRQCHLAAYKF